MSKQLKILVTKKLTDFQKEQLTHFEVVEDEFIKIEFNTISNLQLPVKNAIFTSKNAVKGLLKQFSVKELDFKNVFCVGSKTAHLLIENGINPLIIASNSVELATEIVANKNISQAHFFCGNLRRDELLEIAEENNVKIQEIEVYQTSFTSKRITGKFDAVLFFSPSSIKSYMAGGNSATGIAFCIGNTTASEAVNYFEEVFMAEEPTIEEVIKTLNQYFGYE